VLKYKTKKEYLLYSTYQSWCDSFRVNLILNCSYSYVIIPLYVMHFNSSWFYLFFDSFENFELPFLFLKVQCMFLIQFCGKS
jgi:hypothetical protein